MAEWNTLTLFIDESGTFEDDREPWVVGGVLVADDPVAADTLIQARLHDRWPAIAEAPSQLHMTDLSKRLGPTEATAFASDLLAAPAFLALVAVSNRRKRQAKSRESNYRQMLSDLIALTSNVLDDSRAFDHLHIVVATRTIEHERQSLYDDIHCAINAQAELFARALVSRGLFDRFDSNNVTLHQEVGARSWGLGAADVLCNCAWIAEKDPRSPRARVLGDARLRSKTLVSTAFAKPRHRRAENLRIEGQWGASVAAWLMSEASDERTMELQRVVTGAFGSDASTRGHLAVEGALEVLHRATGLGPASRAKLALELAETLRDTPRAEPSSLRCSLFALLHANHAGDQVLADRAASAAHAALRRAEMPPEHWYLAATLALLESEAALNDLDLPGAWRHVLRHERMVQAFGAAWELVQDGGEANFASSELARRGTMALIRVGLWARTMDGAEARERLARLPRAEGSIASRIRCLMASADEAAGADASVAEQLGPYVVDDAWCAYWALRASANAGSLPAPDLLGAAKRHGDGRGGSPYLRAAICREAALAMLLHDTSLAADFAAWAVAQAATAGRSSEVLRLLQATCVAVQSAALGRPWTASGLSGNTATLATSAGLVVGRPVTREAAIAFRYGSIR